MLIRTKKQSDLTEAQTSDERVYVNRREFMKTAGLGAAAIGAGLYLPSSLVLANPSATPRASTSKTDLTYKKTDYGKKLKPTAYKHVTGYNNFYELGTGKSDPARNAHYLKTSPWSITVEGHAEKTGTFNLEDILKRHPLEERIYRLRCVEAWSMVVPWVGFALADFIKHFKPTSNAKYVEFHTLHNPTLLPGQNRAILNWPYVEGLRMDEAMNPLTLLAVGVYGKQILPQNGAPIRLVIPWKYGFKSIKSIAKVRFTDKQPVSSWMQAAPHEYGFYANVNPQVDHPRWTQKRERIIGSFGRRKTDMFNGYAEQVAHLYKGLDLRKNY